MRSQAITSLLAAVGATVAVSAVITTPVAAAQMCAPGLEVVNDQCVDPDDNAGNVISPQGEFPFGTTFVDGGRVECTQHSCVFREDK